VPGGVFAFRQELPELPVTIPLLIVRRVKSMGRYVPTPDIARAKCCRSVIRRGPQACHRSRARQKSLHSHRYTKLGSVSLLKDELQPCRRYEQVLDERAGSRVGWQAMRAQCALSDAAEPHLSRRDRSQEAIQSPTPIIPLWDAAQGQVASDAAPAKPDITEELQRLRSREGVAAHLIARRCIAHCADVNQEIGKGIEED